jgi:hypothetical protein
MLCGRSNEENMRNIGVYWSRPLELNPPLLDDEYYTCKIDIPVDDLSLLFDRLDYSTNDWVYARYQDFVKVSHAYDGTDMKFKEYTGGVEVYINHRTLITIKSTGSCIVPRFINMNEFETTINRWFNISVQAQIMDTDSSKTYILDVSIPRYNSQVLKDIIMLEDALYNIVYIYEPYNLHSPKNVHMRIRNIIDQGTYIPLPSEVDIVASWVVSVKMGSDTVDVLRYRFELMKQNYGELDRIVGILTLISKIYNEHHTRVYNELSMFCSLSEIIQSRVSIQRAPMANIVIQDLPFYRQPKWVRFCQKNHQPIKVTDANKNTVRDMIEFPPNSGEIWACTPSSQYPHIGLKKNTIAGYSKYTYLPCCFKTNRMARKVESEYVVKGVLPVQDQESVQPSSTEYVIETLKILPAGRRGVLPDNMHLLLGPYNLIRLGVEGDTFQSIADTLNGEYNELKEGELVSVIVVDDTGGIKVYKTSSSWYMVLFKHMGTEFGYAMGDSPREVILKDNKVFQRQEDTFIEDLLYAYQIQSTIISTYDTSLGIYTERNIPNDYMEIMHRNYVVQVQWKDTIWCTTPYTPMSSTSQTRIRSIRPVPWAISYKEGHTFNIYPVTGEYASLKKKRMRVYALVLYLKCGRIATLVYTDKILPVSTWLDDVDQLLVLTTESCCIQHRISSLTPYNLIKDAQNNEKSYMMKYLSQDKNTSIDEYINTNPPPESASSFITSLLENKLATLPSYRLMAGDFKSNVGTSELFKTIKHYDRIYDVEDIPTDTGEYSFWIYLHNNVFLCTPIVSIDQAKTITGNSDAPITFHNEEGVVQDNGGIDIFKHSERGLFLLETL